MVEDLRKPASSDPAGNKSSPGTEPDSTKSHPRPPRNFTQVRMSLHSWTSSRKTSVLPGTIFVRLSAEMRRKRSRESAVFPTASIADLFSQKSTSASGVSHAAGFPRPFG